MKILFEAPLLLFSVTLFGLVFWFVFFSFLFCGNSYLDLSYYVPMSLNQSISIYLSIYLSFTVCSYTSSYIRNYPAVVGQMD